MSQIPPCKHCGSRITHQNLRVYGYYFVIYDENGKVDNTEDDGVNVVHHQTIWCSDCNKRRRDLRWNNGTIEVKSETPHE